MPGVLQVAPGEIGARPHVDDDHALSGMAHEAVDLGRAAGDHAGDGSRSRIAARRPVAARAEQPQRGDGRDRRAPGPAGRRSAAPAMKLCRNDAIAVRHPSRLRVGRRGGRRTGRGGSSPARRGRRIVLFLLVPAFVTFPPGFAPFVRLRKGRTTKDTKAGRRGRATAFGRRNDTRSPRPRPARAGATGMAHLRSMRHEAVVGRRTATHSAKPPRIRITLP